MNEKSQSAFPSFKLKGCIMVIDISLFQKLFFNLNKLKKYNKLMVNLIEMIDLTVFEYLGEIMKIEDNKIIAFWETINNSNNNNNRKGEQGFKEESEIYNINEGYQSASVNSNLSFKKDYNNSNTNVNPFKLERNSQILINTDIENNNNNRYNNNNNNLLNLSFICALKIITRLQKFTKEYKDFNLETINITLNKGVMYNYPVKTDDLYNSSLSGKDLIETIKLQVKLTIYFFFKKTCKKFESRLVFTESIYDELDVHFKSYTRQIPNNLNGDNDNNNNNNKNNNIFNQTFYETDLYTYDFNFDKVKNKNPYKLNFLILSPKQGWLRKKKLMEDLSETSKKSFFSIKNILLNDCEINFSKFYSSSFFIFYEEGVKEFKKFKYNKAKNYFKKALLIKPGDYLSSILIDKIENLKNKKKQL